MGTLLAVVKCDVNKEVDRELLKGIFQRRNKILRILASIRLLADLARLNMPPMAAF